MNTLLLIILFFVISILLYIIRDQRLKQSREWQFWSIRTSSFPPPVIPAQTTTKAHEIKHVYGVEQKTPIPDDDYLTNNGLEQPTLVSTIKKNISQKDLQNISEAELKLLKKKQNSIQDNMRITSMSKNQLDDYLDKNVGRYQNSSISALSNNHTMIYSEALRLASLNLEEVVYINETQWFHLSACEFYPSQTTVSEELLMTIKGSWILKKPGPNIPSECTYQIVSKKDAFIFLEENGFKEEAEKLAPHNPSCEL